MHVTPHFPGRAAALQHGAPGDPVDFAANAASSACIGLRHGLRPEPHVQLDPTCMYIYITIYITAGDEAGDRIATRVAAAHHIKVT